MDENKLHMKIDSTLCMNFKVKIVSFHYNGANFKMGIKVHCNGANFEMEIWAQLLNFR